MAKDDILKDAKEAFSLAESHESENRATAEADIRFARLEEQWPAEVETQRRLEGRPTLKVNKLPAFIRQVVNDQRQNKPSIKVHPADSGADKETAEVYDGLIRNIQYASNADVAYDTATECAVSCGFGYFRIVTEHAHEDTFDLDISIERVANPFSIYGDPHSTAADSSDWNSAFVVDVMSKDAFKSQYPGAQATDWGSDTWADMEEPWLEDEQVMVAEWWTREQYEKEVLKLADGTVLAAEALETEPQLAEIKALVAAGILPVVQSRKAKCWRTKQTILNGAEVLAETPWPGQFIPIVPVYGDEINLKGKRYFRSLIHPALDAQRYFNAWRSISMELAALSPRVPYIGPKGAFTSDPGWMTANRVNHPFLEYDNVPGAPPPQRQPLDVGPAAGAMQEALNASDDMKAIMGIYDASLGARSNETSGRAILARQREGDVSTFHFIDNMSRAIRHAGRILIDLIPKIYTNERIIRVLGEDATPRTIPLGQPVPLTNPKGQPQTDENGQPKVKVYDLAAGKYDLTVTTGPSFTTRREEAAMQMTEMIRALPASAPVLGKHLAKNLDWPGADEIAEELEQMMKPPELPPELQEQIQKGAEELQAVKAENEQIKADRSLDAAKMQMDAELARLKAEVEQQKLALEQQKLALEAARMRMDAQTQAQELQFRQEEVQRTSAEREQDRKDKGLPEGHQIIEIAQQVAPILTTLNEVSGAMQQVSAAVSQLAADAAAPVEIVRKNGKAVGIQKGGKVRQVVRDNGQITGLQ